MWRSLLLALLLIVPPFTHAATGDTGVFVPSVRSPIPDFTVVTGQPLHVNGYFYIPCTTYMGSTDPYAATFTVTPSVPGMGTMNALTGQWDGTPTSSVASVTIKCTTPTGSAQDTFNVTVQAGQVAPFAVGKFIDCGASTNGTGTQSSPWNRTSSITGMTTGMDLWFKGGATCVQGSAFNVTWSGTAADHAVVGSYYLSGATAYQNQPTNFTVSTRPRNYVYTVPRPIIKGSYVDSCRPTNVNPSNQQCALKVGTYAQCTTPVGVRNTDGSWACMGYQGTPVPANFYDPLVSIKGFYVDFQDIEVTDSAGRGIEATEGATGACTSSNAACQKYVTIKRNRVLRFASAGIGVNKASKVVIAFNEAAYGDEAWGDKQPGKGTFREAGNYGVVLCIECDILIEGNDSHNTWGQGIYAYTFSYVLVRGNEIGSLARGDLDGGQGNILVAEQNMVVGGANTNPRGNSTVDRGPSYWTYGFENDSGFLASYHGAKYIWHRNNLSSNGDGDCLQLYTSDTARPGTTVSGRKYGNTCIQTTRPAVATTLVPAAPLDPTDKYKFSNNMFVNTASLSCNMIATNTTSQPFDHNFWRFAPLAACAGTVGDVISSNTGLGSFNFAASSWTSIPNPLDFQPASTGAGATAGSPLTAVELLDWSDPVYNTAHTWDWLLSQRQWLPACNTTGAQVSKSEWQKGLTWDFCGNPRGGVYTMGAITRKP